MLSHLSRAIAVAGKAVELFAMPDGTRLLLLPYGARLVGLYAADNDESFYWNNPLLEHAESARTLFAGSGWHNTGGDRTWIAPELDTFFPDADSKQYWQPRQLDMSDYAVERTGGGIQLSRPMALHLARANRDVRLRLTKWFGPAANPLRYERDMAAVAAFVQYAGYTQRVAVHCLDEAAQPPPAVGIWNLLQLPAGGEMLVPLYSRTVPQKCFGDVPADRVTIEDHLLRVRADFAGSHKIAVKGRRALRPDGLRLPSGRGLVARGAELLREPFRRVRRRAAARSRRSRLHVPDVPGGRGRVRKFLRDGVSCSGLGGLARGGPQRGCLAGLGFSRLT